MLGEAYLDIIRTADIERAGAKLQNVNNRLPAGQLRLKLTRLIEKGHSKLMHLPQAMSKRSASNGTGIT